MSSIRASRPVATYVAYIDEAGDPGTKRVRPIDPVGGTEWMTIAAALFRVENVQDLPAYVGSILNRINVRTRPDLHFRHLSASRQLEACELVGRLPAAYFVVCSNKRNMRGYENPKAAAKMHGKQWFYNFLVRLLIERISHFAFDHAANNNIATPFVRFVFSKRGGHSYSQTKAYHEIMKQQSRAKSAVLRYRLPEWRVLHRDLVEVMEHEESAGLQIADCVASSFYTACDELDTGPRYLEPAQMLRPKMAVEKGRIADFGVVLQPNPFSKNRSTTVPPGTIPKEQRAIFEFYGFSF